MLPVVPVQYAASACGLKLKFAGVSAEIDEGGWLGCVVPEEPVWPFLWELPVDGPVVWPGPPPCWRTLLAGVGMPMGAGPPLMAPGLP